jgi:hypothetical protein
VGPAQHVVREGAEDGSARTLLFEHDRVARAPRPLVGAREVRTRDQRIGMLGAQQPLTVGGDLLSEADCVAPTETAAMITPQEPASIPSREALADMPGIVPKSRSSDPIGGSPSVRP